MPKSQTLPISKKKPASATKKYRCYVAFTVDNMMFGMQLTLKFDPFTENGFQTLRKYLGEQISGIHVIVIVNILPLKG